MSGIGSLSNATFNPLNNIGNSLFNSVSNLSSGKAINSAADNPSGLAIYASLTTQAQGFDAASANVQDAVNATNVADAALQTSTDILQRVNTLAVAATNDFNSPTQNAALQAEAGQLTQQLNTISGSTTFNGASLLSGQFSGTTPATPPTAQVASNDQLLGGGQVVNTAVAPTVAAGTPSQTVQVSVVDTGGGVAQAAVSVVDSATGAVTNIGNFAAGAAVVANGVSFNVGNITTADAGTTATIQVNPGTAFQAGNSATVQSGASQGQTTSVSFANVSAASLGVSNIDFATSANATNAQGVVGNALQSLLSSRAELGAQSASLSANINNNNIASNNLTSSASAIGDLNYGQESTNYALLNTQNQITLNVLKNANHSAGYLSAFFNQGA